MIYESTYPVCYSIIYKMTRDVEETLDLVQEVYMMAYDKREHLNEESNVNSWIYRIAANLTLNAIRRKKFLNDNAHHVLFMNTPLDPSSDPFVRRDQHGLIWQLLEKIDPKYRDPLILRDVDDRTYEEIALDLNDSLANIKTRIHRGRKKLLELYQKEEKHHDK